MKKIMRHAEVSITYQGKDITENIASYLQSFEYSEEASGAADSLSITLTDVDQRWLNAWFPQSGDSIVASLTQYDWANPGDVVTLNCGQMMVDSPAFRSPPDTLDLKALQIPADLDFSDTPRDTTWNQISMSQLAQEIASRYNLTLQYLAPSDIVIHALKRTKQSDSDLLSNTCKKYNYALKVYNSRLCVFSPMVAEQAAPVVTITRGESSVQDVELEAPFIMDKEIQTIN
jgi:phage protein D